MKFLVLLLVAVASAQPPMMGDGMMDMPAGDGPSAGMGEAGGMPMPEDVKAMVGKVAMKMKMVKMMVRGTTSSLFSVSETAHFSFAPLL